MKAVDVSNWTGPISAEQMACLRDSAGIGLVVAGTQAPAICRQQLQTAVEAGLWVEAYVYLYWRHEAGVAGQVSQAAAAVKGLPVRRLWLDCEDAPNGLPPQELVALIGLAVRAAQGQGLAPGIYTGRWWWAPHTGNSTAFQDLPLWHAEYPRSGFGAWEERPRDLYGGWLDLAMWQYRGSHELCGVTVDANVLPDPPRPAPDPVVTPQQLKDACISAAQFVRMGWDLRDLVDVDKAALRELARRVDG